MISNRKIFLYFVKLFICNVSNRVLLCIYCVLVQSHVQFGECNRCGVRTQCLEECNVIVILHGTKLLSLKVSNACNRSFVTCNLTESVFHKCQSNHSIIFQSCHHISTYMTVKNHPRLIIITVYKGNIHNFKLRVVRYNRCK